MPARKHVTAIASITALTALVVGCSSTPASAASVSYENTIRQLIDKRCSECHGGDAPSMQEFKKDEAGYKAEKLGPRMDSYENLMVMVNGSDAGAIMRRLDDGANTRDGKPGNMYRRLGSDDAQRAANLALFKQWIGGWSLKRAKDISEAERKAVLAPRD